MQTITELLELQSGVVARHQVVLRPRENDATIRRRLRRREWAQVHTGVYVDHTGPLTWLQRAWAAVLFPWPAALAQDSALRAADGPGKRGRSDDDPVHVLVDRKRRVKVPDGIVMHHSDRLHTSVQWNTSPPRVRLEHAVLDHVARSADLDLVAAWHRWCSHAGRPRRGAGQRWTNGTASRGASSSQACSTTSAPAPARRWNTATWSGWSEPTAFRWPSGRSGPRREARSIATCCTRPSR